MTFTLHIEIAGLCMLVRRSDELLVLLPETPSDTNEHEHRHHPVIASPKKYQPERKDNEGYEKGGFFVHDLREKTYDFGLTPELPYLRFGLDAFNVHDISTCAREKTNPDYARVQISLPCGGPFTKHGGAHWRPNGDESATPVVMATRLTWSIRGLSNTVDERLGLKIPMKSEDGTTYYVVLRPDDSDNVKMSLYHTLKKELPGEPTPSPEQLRPKQAAPHFAHLLDLLEGEDWQKCKAPLFERPGPLLTPTDSLFDFRQQRFHDDSGRRYSCLLVTTEE